MKTSLQKNRLLIDHFFIAENALDLMYQPVICINKSNKIELLNDSAAAQLNYTKKELIGKNISMLMENPKSFDLINLTEIKLRQQEGTIISAEISTEKILDEKNKIAGYYLIINRTDKVIPPEIPKEFEEKNKTLDGQKITLEMEKKELDQKIHESTLTVKVEQARLLASINNLSLGYILTDNEKNITFINKTAKNFFGIQDKDASEIKSIFIPLLGNIEIKNSIDQSLKDGKPITLTDFIINDKHTNISISPIIMNQENLSKRIGAIIIIDDKSEERLLKRSKENFFLIASHELRTPLTGIRGYIEIIKQMYMDDIKDSELKRIISDIDASSRRLINIINDFLDKSKLEEDKITVQLAPCDLVPLLQSSIKDTESLSIEKKLYIKFNNSLPNAIVLGDNDKLKEVFINLISNSIKYTDRGGVTIGIDKTQDGKFKVTFSDTGKGIPPENQKTLFSKYQQTGSNKLVNVVSTGLGLYISKLLAEKMNGVIQLEYSEEGKGSTFSVSLPIYSNS